MLQMGQEDDLGRKLKAKYPALSASYRKRLIDAEARRRAQPRHPLLVPLETRPRVPGDSVAVEHDGCLNRAAEHRFDEARVFAEEKARNRAHNLKYKEAMRASAKRRAADPRHQASTRAVARIGAFLRSRAFQENHYPGSTGKVIPLKAMLGCPFEIFKKYFESLFVHPMKWNNYGKTWQVGHRVPIRLFDCREEPQLKACFHYRNLQPEFPERHLRRLNEAPRRRRSENWLG